MKLFVGLGNPGSAYARHRHNIGFMAVDRIAERHGFGPWLKRFAGLSCEGEIDGRRVRLLKPLTFMNESGRSVSEAQRFLKLALRDIVVFHDELDLAPGKIRVKSGGGDAGHNGLRSISAHIGNDYVRVRIGIGHPGAKELVERYVLHDFSKADAAWREPLLDAIADCAGRLAAGEDARFLTDVAHALRAAERKTAAEKRENKKGPGQRELARRAVESGSKKGPGKSVGALADNIKRWLQGRKIES
jgi:PTH1 family peptidyl-tRNA hydrolase